MAPRKKVLMSSLVLDLWDQGPPSGGVQYSAPEVFADQTGDDQRLSRAYFNVSQPTLTVHKPAPERANGAAVVVFPGGGYQAIMADYEGHDVARWLNLIGVTATVVKYRTAPRPAQENVRDKVRLAALADAKRAMRLVCHHAAEWGIDPKRVGTLGFSAGGRLILDLALNANGGQPDAADPVERQSCVPRFTIPVYPDVPQDLSGLGPNMGPMFIVHGSRDTLVPPQGSLRLCQALLETGVPVELHLFGQGEHGFGLGITGGTARRWPDLCEEWMRDLGVLVSP
jgi:acetyl esterase/lipase